VESAKPGFAFAAFPLAAGLRGISACSRRRLLMDALAITTNRFQALRILPPGCAVNNRTEWVRLRKQYDSI